MRRTGVTLALAVMLGLAGAGPASASQATTTDTMSPSAAQVSDGAMIDDCTRRRPPSDWRFAGAYFPPEACFKCIVYGRQWESTGNWKAWCHIQQNGVALYLFCVGCRED